MELTAYEPYSRIKQTVLAENRRYSNIAELLFYGEGYVRDAMRQAGAEEKKVSGNSSDYEKFRELCRLSPLFRENPAEYVCNYILREIFDCSLSPIAENCDEIWRLTSKKLTETPLTPLGLLECFNIKELSVLTDISESPSSFKSTEAKASTRISPALCLNSVLDIDRRGYKKTVVLLSKPAETPVYGISELEGAISAALDRFKDAGCRRAILSGISISDFEEGAGDYYHAELALKKSVETDGRVSSAERRDFRRYILPRLAEACRSRQIDLALDFCHRPLELLPSITLCDPKKRRIWLNFSQKEGLPAVREGYFDPRDDIKAQITAYASRYALGTVPPFSAETESVAELCLHRLFQECLEGI